MLLLPALPPLLPVLLQRLLVLPQRRTEKLLQQVHTLLLEALLLLRTLLGAHEAMDESGW